MCVLCAICYGVNILVNTIFHPPFEVQKKKVSASSVFHNPCPVTFCIVGFHWGSSDLPWDLLEYVKKKKFDNYWRKLSDSIPQKEGIRWFFNCHQIWSLNPIYWIFAFWRLFQEIIWSESSLKFQNTNLLDRLWITKILFTNVKWGNIFLF